MGEGGAAKEQSGVTAKNARNGMLDFLLTLKGRIGAIYPQK